MVVIVLLLLLVGGEAEADVAAFAIFLPSVLVLVPLFIGMVHVVLGAEEIGGTRGSWREGGRERGREGGSGKVRM